MQYDWLLGLPKASWAEQKQWVAERLAEDPAAAAISDEQAELFFAAAHMVRFMGFGTRAAVARALGVRLHGGGEKSVRMSTVAMLRRWKDRTARNLMIMMITNCAFPNWPDPVTHPDFWTEEAFDSAFHHGVNIVWLVRLRRHLGMADNLSEWFASLADWAEDEYRIWLDTGRLTMRRLVYPDQAAPVRQTAAALQTTMAELREKDQLTGGLRSDMRRLERDRKTLKQRTREAALKAKASLSQARGDVTAARRSLSERPRAQREELEAQARRFEHDLRLLRQLLDSARQEFARALTEATGPGRAVLEGRRITVTDCQGQEESCRLLVESIGARWVPDGGEVVLSAAGGLVALERSLRDLALNEVLITCDGLYRRKDGRHGVAISGVQVQVSGVVIYQESSVVNCGPCAGSLMAEYGAVALALSWLRAASPPPEANLVVLSDCKSLLRRLRRKEGVKRKRGCMTLDTMVRRSVRLLQSRGNEVQFRWVPRERVEVVDRLCDRAYRELRWYHRRGSKQRWPLQEFVRSALRQAPAA